MKEKIVVFSGAGISAESGIETFRSETGLWNNHNILDVCHPDGWANNPQKVLNFYNQLRKDVGKAEPNIAHKALADLEEDFEVIVITQNIDNLHERGGSKNVIHVHGEVTKVRSDSNVKCHLYDVSYNPISIGDVCLAGYQLRPHVVWFTESPFYLDEAANHFLTADKVLIVGTSLDVYPAAALVDLASNAKDKILVVPEQAIPPQGYTLRQGTATSQVPAIVKEWIKQKTTTNK